MSLHHATLKAAVKAYGPLHTEGKTEEEVKAAIAADEKDFDADAVNEIYAAITAGPEKNPEVSGYIVKTEFRDKDNFEKLHKIGDDVSHFDENRKADLLSRGLIVAQV